MGRPKKGYTLNQKLKDARKALEHATTTRTAVLNQLVAPKRAELTKAVAEQAALDRAEQTQAAAAQVEEALKADPTQNRAELEKAAQAQVEETLKFLAAEAKVRVEAAVKVEMQSFEGHPTVQPWTARIERWTFRIAELEMAIKKAKEPRVSKRKAHTKTKK